MKKNNYSIVLGILLLLVASCQVQEKSKILGGPDAGSGTKSLSPDDIYKYRKILKELEECPKRDTGRCSEHTTLNCEPVDVYCHPDNAVCIQKIICCHNITEEQFNALLEDAPAGYAVFTNEQIENIVTKSECNSHRIRFRVENGWYYITRTDADDDDGGVGGSQYVTFYSVALLKGIFDSGIESVTLYRGINIDGIEIIPFKVLDANGEEKYYDLSDSQP